MTIDAPPRAESRITEERLGVLQTDRPCAKCGFNLHGATIMREPHYRMLIARCPECGVPAALQEYPALAPWVSRLRLLAAAVWVGAILLSVLIAAIICYAFAESAASTLSAQYQGQIDTALREHWQAKGNGANPNTPVYYDPQQVEDWWNSQPPSKFLAEHGGLLGALNWWGLVIWIWVLVAMFPVGVLWSILLARAGPTRRVLIALATALLAGGFYYVEVVTTRTPAWYGWGAYWTAQMQVGWLPAILTLAFCSLCLVIGMALGRPLARWIVSTFLPPRQAASFSMLWIVDGKPLPRPAA